MSRYSDEPNMITPEKRSRGRFLWIGGIILFIGLLLSVAFFPKFLEFQRRRTPFGPHFGSTYRISFEGNKFEMELARSEEYDFRTAIYVEPVKEGVEWSPETHEFRLRLEGLEEFEILPWDPVEKYFGLSEHQVHPSSDIRMELELLRDEKVVWSGKRWSFRMSGGHGH